MCLLSTCETHEMLFPNYLCIFVCLCAVSCELGRLYNKDSVIEFLLKRDTFPGDAADHIRSLKDVIELKLTQRTDCPVTADVTPFICPVVGLEMNGKYRFCYLRKCGCVMSERAMKEVKSENCHRCAAPFDADNDVIVINGCEEQVEKMRTAITDRRAKEKADKRSKKRKNTEAADDMIRLKEADHPVASSSGAYQKDKQPVRESEKKKKNRSIADDPNASEAYKSLFTSHETAKNKPKSNWVTYNPLYF